jgi:hypothetical protein
MLLMLRLLAIRIYIQYIPVNVTWCGHLEYIRKQSEYVTFIRLNYILRFSERFL